jgi:hypothetical protein
MSNNLVRDYLEELCLISSQQFMNNLYIDGDEWEIYKLSDDTLLYVRFELAGKIGYAFCVKIICRKMTNNFESFYYVKSYGNEVKEKWDCDQLTKDRLMGNAIEILQPY